MGFFLVSMLAGLTFKQVKWMTLKSYQMLLSERINSTKRGLVLLQRIVAVVITLVHLTVSPRQTKEWEADVERGGLGETL